MLKKRVIFTLFYQDGFFHLSRNFRLQRVGDADFLLQKFRFLSIGNYIDELIILDVSRDRDANNVSVQLEEDIQKLMKNIFVPLTLGGGIRDIGQAVKYFQIGADKISLNWAIAESPSLVADIVAAFGSQAVMASVDVKKEEERYNAFINNGKSSVGSLHDYLKIIEDLKMGEVLINSIERDGTGTGLDLPMLEGLPPVQIPIIACGGAGKPIHFIEALRLPNISAVATGNLFNFIGSGFKDARQELCQSLPNIREILVGIG